MSLSPLPSPTQLPDEEGPAAAPTTLSGVWNGAGEPSLPVRFGRYELLRLLGRGGMGTVFLAHDTQLDRLVALKMPSFHGDERLAARFLLEARAAATLSHPNLCAVYDCGAIDGALFLTMAYIEGRPLSALIQPGKLLPVAQVVAIVSQIALALQEAHDHGVIHRDLKPANVMINRKGQPVVMDFGLARRKAPGQDRLSWPGLVMGTPRYMAPEQAAGDQEAIGPSSDVYALGVILYELLTGKTPFEGPAATLMANILFEPPPPPSKERPDLDPRLEAACLKALAKKPGDRHESMASFARALTGGEAVPRRKVSQRGALWLIAGGVVLLLLALLSRARPGLALSIPGLGRWFAGEASREQRWNEKGRSWRAPSFGIASERLFLLVVGPYQRESEDHQADCPELGIRRMGRHAVYNGPERIEVFVYRATELEKEALMSRAAERLAAINKDRVGAYRKVTGSPRGAFLAYDLGPDSGSAMRYGVLWWDKGWLFHARSRKAPDGFLDEYLRALAAEADKER